MVIVESRSGAQLLEAVAANDASSGQDWVRSDQMFDVAVEPVRIIEPDFITPMM